MRNALSIGSRGQEVQELKKLLNEKFKLNPKLVENDLFDKQTDSIVKRYQLISYLGVDGSVDAEMLISLKNNKVVAADKPAVVPAQTAPWMKIAAGEIGQRELKGVLHNPRIITYHATTTLRATKDETPWCSSFVNWVMIQAGKKGTNSALAISWLNWGKPTSLQHGAIIVIHNSKATNSALSYSGNHVAFLVRETNKYYEVLGGNQLDQVKTSRYPKSTWALKACRWPV